MAERQVPSLNSNQVDAILTEALSRGLIEPDSDGNLPSEADDRLHMAQTLVGMAHQSFLAGSRDDDVAQILFIAEVDMQPQVDQTEGGGTDMASSSMDSIDDETLVKIERSLQVASDAGEDNSIELTKVREELVRRGLAVVEEPAAAGNGTATPTDDSAERTALEEQLTIGLMRAHGLDPSEIASTSTATLRWMIEHPDPKQPAPAAGVPAQVAAVADPVPGDMEERVRILPPPAADVAAHESEATADDSGISAEREALESQVTGPMLKAFGRGRLDIPNIGDNELAFMVANPEGRVTKEQLMAARALDEAEPITSVQESAPAPIAEQLAAERHEEPVQEAVAPAPTGDAAFAPPVAVEPRPKPQADPKPAAVAPIEAPAPRVPVDPATLHVPEEAQRDVKEHFAQTVAKEHFPYPQDIEDPPSMPADMSKLTREEIYSLHARFHAVQARIAIVITDDEDKLGDMQKLRRARELAVEETIPVNIDGKKLTEAQRSARIAQDEQVQIYATAEHNLEKSIRKMKVLAGNYNRDVERSSRQMTRWSKEFAEGS
jgi:hypothetical protein